MAINCKLNMESNNVPVTKSNAGLPNSIRVRLNPDGENFNRHQRYIDSVGTIELIDETEYPFRVEWESGVGLWYKENDLIMVNEEIKTENEFLRSATAVIGQEVRLNLEKKRGSYSWKYDAYEDKVGKLKKNDGSSTPFLVEWPNTETVWYSEEELFVVKPEKVNNVEKKKVVIAINNESEYAALITHYKSKGWSWYGGLRVSGQPYKDEMKFIEYKDKFHYSSKSNENEEVVQLNALASIAGFDIPKIRSNKKFRISNEYEAVVNYQTEMVDVGCQHIPFELVRKIAEATKVEEVDN